MCVKVVFNKEDTALLEATMDKAVGSGVGRAYRLWIGGGTHDLFFHGIGQVVRMRGKCI